ncbi:helix-turn-helix domain-containing protein [Sphingobacterium bambusae]|uniref:Helix-turn-helix domain-containing protein n=1 Tax=Sphingobacterium bambusae TaxID=662858 RepID=A0ABW6BKN6_9SPHI|nr:helix-turn-helix transcriptional regulator [Sphingobacterium bambusae]WPL49702.1 helix-turn-helix transcriptional regulator [Sphingobacterium bambusae]
MSTINKEILKEIGINIKSRREEISYSQKDLSNMTGLTINMISTFENGKGATLNNFLLICRALKIQPKDILHNNIDLEPLYDLPPESKRRIEGTRKLDDLVVHTDFFDFPKRVSEVLKKLDYDKSQSNKFSVYLSGYCKEGKLEYIKEGNIKKYRKKQ